MTCKSSEKDRFTEFIIEVRNILANGLYRTLSLISLRRQHFEALRSNVSIGKIRKPGKKESFTEFIIEVRNILDAKSVLSLFHTLWT